MRQHIAIAVMSAASFVCSGSIPVFAQSGLNIPDNGSVYVDAKSFQVAQGKAKADSATQLRALGGRELGPGAIIFRSGEKLYIIDGAALTARAAYDPSIRGQAYDPSIRGQAYDPSIRGQAYDPSIRGQAYDPSIRGQAYDPSIRGQAYDPSIRGQAYDPSIRGQAYDPSIRGQAYDPSIRGQAYDPSIRGQAYDPSAVYINDPDYVQYRLKKAFEDNWTSTAK